MNQTLDTIYKLRSIHGNFSSQEISEENLKTILSSAVRAATASARQSYSIIVISDKSVMKNYFNYVGSKALLFCVDYNRIQDTADYLTFDYECGNLPNFLTGCVDAGLAAQTAAIAAKSLGIDSLFTNSVQRVDLADLYQKLNLPPKYCFPFITLVLGYAADSEQLGRGRLAGPGIIHFEKYQHALPEELQEIIKDYDNEEKRLGLTYERKNKSGSYFDWFFNVWSKKTITSKKQKEAELYTFLKKAGFLN